MLSQNKSLIVIKNSINNDSKVDWGSRFEILKAVRENAIRPLAICIIKKRIVAAPKGNAVRKKELQVCWPVFFGLLCEQASNSFS